MSLNFRMLASRREFNSIQFNSIQVRPSDATLQHIFLESFAKTMRSKANSTLPMPYHRVQHSQSTAFSKLLRSVAVRGHPSLKLQISMNKQLNSVEAASDGESKVVHSPLAPNRKSGSRRMAFAPPPPRWLALHLSCV